MMVKRTVFSTIILFILLLNVNTLLAQTGPSDATSNPPATASDVNKVLTSGQNIVLVGPQDANQTDFAQYQWYKVDANGNKQLTGTTGKTYTEAPTAPGYYDYQLVTQNGNGCSSPGSDIFKVYVLPKLAPSVTTDNSSLCAAGSSSVVLNVANVPAGYTLNYQWTQNGVNITGATTNSYTVNGTNLSATVTFGVIVSYALNPSSTVTATKDIAVVPMPSKPMITAN